MLRAEKKIHVNYRVEEENNDGNTNASSLAKNLCLNGLHVVLPEFYRAVSTLATIPATSCSAERLFSGLHRMKTYLRSTMGQERLMNTALKNIERKYSNEMLKHDVEKIIDAFGNFYLFSISNSLYTETLQQQITLAKIKHKSNYNHF